MAATVEPAYWSVTEASSPPRSIRARAACPARRRRPNWRRTASTDRGRDAAGRGCGCCCGSSRARWCSSWSSRRRLAGAAQWWMPASSSPSCWAAALLGFSQEYRASTRGRGAQAAPGADLPRAARRRRATIPVQHDRAGRRRAAVGRQSHSRPTGCVLEAQDFLVSEASMTGRIVPGGEAAGHRCRRGAARGAHQRRVPGRFGAQRHGARCWRWRPGRRTEFGAIAARLAGAPAGDGVRARRAAVRLPADPRDGGDRAVRADGEPAARPAR